MSTLRYSEITEMAGSHHAKTNVRSIVTEMLENQKRKNKVDNTNASQEAKNMIETEAFKRGLDKYFAAIDEKNSSCRCITFWSMLTFGVVATFIIVMIQIFVNNGYQEFDPAVGFVTASVNGIALATSPTMNAKDAIVYDGRDIVVPSKERNALFVTTTSYEVANQERGICMGMDVCECLSPDQPCSQCPTGTSGTSGLYTGKCVKVSADGVTPEDRRCEVSAWCPVLGFQRMQESAQGTIDPSLTMKNIETFDVKVTVNTRFPKFQDSTQHNLTTTVKKLFDMTMDKIDNGETLAKASKDGAMIFVQFTYDCDVDHHSASKCKPSITAERLDDFTESEDGPQRGYGFKTVDYFSMSDKSTMARRVRHLHGLRFIFDVTGRARKYSEANLLMTIVSGFGFAALAFVIVNEARLLCEVTSAVEKKKA